MAEQEAATELVNLLNQAIARELQVSIQYMFQHSMGGGLKTPGSSGTPAAKRLKFVATRWPYFLPGESLKKTAITEMRHAEAIAEQVVRLGGEPTTEPAPITLGESAEEMLEIDRAQERGAIELYKRIIDAADRAKDDAIKSLFQRILADEEHHHRIFSELLQA